MVDVNQELDNLAIHLKNVTLQRDASPSKRCDDASCCGIDLIFQGLKDTKLKRKSLKILEQNFKAYPSETQQTLMQKISKRVENEEKFVLLKQILDLLDGPQIIRQSLIIGLEKMCTLAMETIQKTHPIVGESRSIQGVGKDILDSELFNAIKICVSVFQNYGTEMMNDIFGGSSDQTWSKWVQELITRLLAILRGKTFQKEIIGMAGIALAHVVNNQPKLEHSLQLASLIIEKSAEITEHHIGPLRIRVESCFAEDSSVLGKIMAYNGLLSVCNPNILLADLTITFKTGSILMGAFTTISESCSESLHAAIKYSSFQVLNSWMECITRISMPVYHEKAGNKESLFQESSTCCKKLLDLIWDNRESMIDGVPKFVHSIFRRLIELHESENITLGKQPQQSELFEMIAAKLLQDPWYMKGRYSLLCELLPHFDSSKILQLHPSLASEVCKCFGTSTLQSIANECYRSIVLNARSASSLSSGEKFWTPEYWSSVWMELLLNLLKEENLRAVHNAVLYFIPTTLQHVDGIFERIKDSISKELQVLSNCLEKSPAEIMSIRSKLLFGYCSVFKLARKSGLATLSDIDTDILKESLVHVNDDVRAAAISVLCYNNKTTEPITELEETLLWDFLPVNLNCASSSFRQSFFVSLKAFFARVRDSSIMMLRNYTKESNRNQNHKREAVPFPERLEASIDLVEKIVSLALRNLFPGASFQRRRTGLQIFYTVLETFSSPSDAVKKGRTVESLKSLTDWVSKNGRWKFITLQNLKTIVSCLEDQHDEIRELAMTITNWFHFETMKIDDIEKERFCKEMLNRATALMSSPKIRDAESGAILMEFIAKRFTNMDDFSLNEEASSSVPTLLTNTSSHLTITELVLYLVNKMHDDIKKSENDVLHSAVYSPVFGYTLAARRCFCSLVQSIKSSSKSSSVISEDTVKSLALLSSKVVHTCIPAIKTAMSVFSKKNEEAQGTSPSFADINDSLGRMLLSCKSYTVLKDSIGNQHCLELLSSFCWLNIKAASLFLGDVGKILSLQSLSSSQKKAVITDDLVNVVGRMFKETLINCRHKGVIENSCTGFQIFCKSLSSENLESLCDWLDETVAACDKNDLSSSITKRSAGLPMFVQSIISSCVSLPLFNLGKYMKWLIEIAKRPVPSTGKMETDLPQVQAMNILRGIYRDSSIGTEVLQFAEDGLTLAVEGFSSSSWAIRNAAQILLGALVPRMLGQRVTQADKSYHNSASPDQFFSRYPALEDFFIRYLRLGVDHKNQLKLLPALVPILTLLSKLRPCGNERYSSAFSSLLDNLLSSYVITVRNLAASSLVVFLSLDQIPAFAGQTILKEINTNCSCNYRHGLLLVIKKLLGVSEDDTEVLDLALTKGIWPHLDSLLNFNHGRCTEYFSRSTVFEIISIIISFMTEMLTDVSILFQDKISKIIKKQAQYMSVIDDNSHQEQIGYCLFVKRFAKASIDLVICMQSRTVDQANEFLETLLSTNQNLLEQELLEDITCHLENGGFLHDTLKLKICRTLIHRILRHDEENISLYLNCWCALGVNFQKLGVTEETLSALLQISTQLLSSERSHRELSASLPFIGSSITPFCQAVGQSSSLYDDFTTLLSLWCGKVYICSAPGEREILRISSLRALKASVESILLHTESTIYSFSNKSMEHLCTRLILALLLLVQDEDEDIRKETCVVVHILNPIFCRKCQLNSPMQNNLALKAIFDFVSKKLWNNVELIKELFTILADICNVDDGLEDTANHRSLLLFEQEGSNLFAEDLVFASEIINCLRICCSNVTTNVKTLPDDVCNELKLTLNQAARNNINKLKRLVKFVDSKPIYVYHGGFLGNSKTFVSLYICVVLSGVLHVNEIIAEDDREMYLRLLEKLKERHLCSEVLGTEVDQALKLMTNEHE